MVRAIRGAIQVGANDRDSIIEGTTELVAQIMARNELTTDDVISVLFTATPDLTAEFPALAARKLGFHDVPLICTAEIDVPGALPRVVRLHGACGDRPAARRHPASTCVAPSRCARTSLSNQGSGTKTWPPNSAPFWWWAPVSSAPRWRWRYVRRACGCCSPTVTRAPSGWRASWARGGVAAGRAAGGGDRPRGDRGAAGPGRRRLLSLQKGGVARFYTDVASVKAEPIECAARLGCDLTSYVASHPLAGREKSGPGAGLADLFLRAGRGRSARRPRRPARPGRPCCG